MLHFVRLRASWRALRLFGCACCRLVWDELPGDECCRAVALAEAYAEDRLAEAEREAERRHINRVIVRMTGKAGRLAQAAAELLRPLFSPLRVAQRARTGPDMAALVARQADALRDIVGDPFRPPRLDRDWLIRHGEPAMNLARRIADEQSFHLLPALADALEQAHCPHAALIEHCRSSVAHVRGCWTVNLFLEQS